jgi:hypothetical protein
VFCGVDIVGRLTWVFVIEAIFVPIVVLSVGFQTTLFILGIAKSEYIAVRAGINNGLIPVPKLPTMLSILNCPSKLKLSGVGTSATLTIASFVM